MKLRIPRTYSFSVTLFNLTLLLLLVNACAGPKTIRKDGLAYLKVGDAMPEKGTAELEGRPLRDTLFNENGYSWRVCIVDYKEGTVLVEGDFAAGTTVNRIRVQTPDLKVKGGLRVGTAVAELKAKTEDWIVRPFPAYGLLEFISLEYPGRIFLVRQQGFDFEDVPEELELRMVSDEARVVAIVVM